MSLDQLIEFIVKNYQFNPTRYPDLANGTEAMKKLFPINHLGLHFTEQAGKIAGLLEDAGHEGKSLNMDGLKEQVYKSLINTLRLAELVGMTGIELEEMVKKKYSEPS